MIITKLNYNRALITSNCFSSNIQFIEGGKEVLEQLDKEVYKLNATNWATGPSLVIKLLSWTLPMLVAAIALVYRK